ncbi:MAG: 5'-nucleotidase C-terminal domain-containing protein [Pseudolabrys sp.]|nr:5'-nucleotidase C-terminal domain-containing protein [Pseudolabrys sp.]MDP2297886.1 5'-nucleotidase C-terminal domain-containing protein [Pseudolabrys sp.]
MADRKLTLFQMNDTHAYLEPHPELVWGVSGPSYPIMGGYARIATLLARVRKENPGGVIALDNGDTFHGTYPAIISKGEAVVPLVNALKLDAMTAHWEFAWGPAHFMEMAGRLAHPVLAINCYDKTTDVRPFPASTVLERAGLRVAVIGIAATIIDKSMPRRFSEGLRFTLGTDELPDEISRLRSKEGANLIVVLSHLGFPQDVKLAGAIAGIDVIVSGHTHNRLDHPARAGGTLIMQSGCHGSFLGKLDLHIENGRIAGTRHQLIPVDESVAPDAEMEVLVDCVMAPHRPMLSEVIGHTCVGLHRNTTLHSSMDDVLLAAIARAAHAKIAFSNGWRYGAPVPPGPVRMNDLWNIIPTNPPVSAVEMTGAEIREMMEENLETTFSSDPFGQMGGYLKRFRGLTIYGKIENPRGHRIEHVFTQEGPLEAGVTYRVAFVTEQGVPEKFGRNRRHLAIAAIDAMREFLGSTKSELDDGIGRFVAS